MSREATAAMRKSHILSRRRLLAAAAAMTLAFAGSAAAASNTVPFTGGGDGHAAISSYAVVSASAAYTLNDLNPQALDQVRFQLSPAPLSSATVRAKVNTGATWYTCSVAGAVATCNTTSPAQALALSGTTAVNELRVTVVD